MVPHNGKFLPVPLGNDRLAEQKDQGRGGLQLGTVTALLCAKSCRQLLHKRLLFEDAEFQYDGTEHRLEVSGELPEDVTVEYVENARTKSGMNKAVAVFKKDNRILEYRIARLNVIGTYSLETDKTEYLQGEPIMATATGSGDDWVAIYRKEDTIGSINSIYWYYVAQENHLPGQSYNIANEAYNSTRAEYKDLPAGEYT